MATWFIISAFGPDLLVLRRKRPIIICWEDLKMYRTLYYINRWGQFLGLVGDGLGWLGGGGGGLVHSNE